MPSITRRDLLNGMLWTSAGMAVGWPLDVMAQRMEAGAPYPPALTGMRGSHPGAFEHAHALAWAGQKNFTSQASDEESVDCVIVGAGISGLTAAYFYRQHVKQDARILLLDNHDDFGGHAKRNEFTVNGTTYLSYGGTQSFDTPSEYSKVARRLLKAMGIDLEHLHAAYDQRFFKRFDVGLGIYYDAATYGSHRLLKSSLPTHHEPAYYSRYFVPGMPTAPTFRSTLNTLPLTNTQRNALTRVMTDQKAAKHFFKNRDIEKSFYEDRYVDYLKEAFGIEDNALIALLSMPLAEDYALVGHAISIADAMSGGLLGLPDRSFFEEWVDADDLPEEDDADDEDEYAYHFPDGNATLARLLIKQLIPDVANFDAPESCLTARFDYARLDRPDQRVNVRLNSLALQVDRKVSSSGAESVQVHYVKQQVLHKVNAKYCVMAGWNMMAAHIIPSLPEQQKLALRANIKMPLVYAQVALRQWQPLQRSGVITTYCPGAYFQFVVPDFPVNIGSYQPQRDPSQPLILLMIRNPCPTQAKGSVPDLLRQGRAELLGTTFEQFENQIRAQLNGMYGTFGFVADRDIAAITVNRWPHGYVYDGAEFNGEPAHRQARKRHGNIVFANADSNGQAYTDAAIDSAWRAVSELT